MKSIVTLFIALASAAPLICHAEQPQNNQCFLEAQQVASMIAKINGFTDAEMQNRALVVGIKTPDGLEFTYRFRPYNGSTGSDENQVSDEVYTVQTIKSGDRCTVTSVLSQGMRAPE